MARQLIGDMSGRWDPHEFTDSFKHDILALVERKVKAGQLHTFFQPGKATPEAVPEAAPLPFGPQILNLADLLQRSLRDSAAPDSPPPAAGPKGKPRTRRATDKKPPDADGTGNRTPETTVKRRSA